MSNEAFATNLARVSIVTGGGDPLALEKLSPQQLTDSTIAEAYSTGQDLMTWTDFSFDPAPDLTMGANYFILLRMSGNIDPGQKFIYWGIYNYWQGAMSDSYPGGRAFFCGQDCIKFEVEPLYRDLEFMTYMTDTPEVCM